MKRVRWFLVVVLLILIIGALGTVLWLLLRDDSQSRFEYRGVPIINIDLRDVSVDEIDEGSKETKYYSNKVTIYDNNKTNEYLDVEIKGRGNGTWSQEKKPYRIKFDEKVGLFDMGKAKTWCLLANAVDATKLRTEMAFNVARMLEMDYAMEGKFVELYVNGEYRGLYYLTHEMGIGKSVVDLKDPFGILVELDNLYWSSEEYYETHNGDKFVVKDAVVDDNAKLAMENFLTKFNALEFAISRNDFKRIEELADVESFAKYYLLSEFVVNPDAYWTSFYFNMDGIDDKIHAGPGWDFDLAFANRRWGNWLGERFYSPTETMIRKEELMSEQEYAEKGLENWWSSGNVLSRIMFELVRLPEFQEEVKRLFNEFLLGKRDEVVNVLLTRANEIEGLVKIDEEKWEGEGFCDEVDKMADWITERYNYMESLYLQN